MDIRANRPIGIPWDEVEDAATSMFGVWACGSELEWASECWSHFEREGLTSEADIIETTRSYLRLVALAKIYQEFSGLMWDEDPQWPLTQLAEDLEIDPISLGILAKSDPEFNAARITDIHRLKEHALTVATDGLRSEIYGCLHDAYGCDELLYSRMVATIKSRDELDDEDEPQDTLAEFEPTGSHTNAFTFVCSGFCKGF